MENNNGFDFIITSPPYNTNVKANAKKKHVDGKRKR